MIINHESKAYNRKWALADMQPERALSEYVTDKIIPKVKTDRDWVTVNIGQAADGAVVVIHEGDYSWLGQHKDLILLCTTEERAESVKAYGKTVVLPGKIRDDVKAIQEAIAPAGCQ